jgi:hypothetical protein
MKARSLQLLDKAKAALISAIEIYNKPDFEYREETFSILALNAWELLLKAKVLADNDNDPRSIYIYERRTTKSGQKSCRQYIRRNRAGNPHTLGLGKLISVLDNDESTRLPPGIKGNLDALVEIRDNAVHYVNASPQLAKQVLEVGNASLRNFIELAGRWFALDLSEYSLYLMPMGFIVLPGSARAITPSSDERKVIEYLMQLIGETAPSQSSGYHVALEVNVSLTRSSAASVPSVSVTDDPGAPEVRITEENIRQTYPWDYRELTQRLRARYTDFKANQKYHDIRMPLKSDERYVKVRHLDPGNPKSSKKAFYNPNIFKEFDKHYSRA